MSEERERELVRELTKKMELLTFFVVVVELMTNRM